MAKPALLFALLVIIGLGCGDAEKPTGPGESKKTTSSSSASQGKTSPGGAAASNKKPRPARVKRTSMAGNWVLQSLVGTRDRGPVWIPLALIKISAEKGRVALTNQR
ncbi:MAG: hypothetical protein IID45_07235 [Planctomycetes bacterium]|nr:hypothetical protein [Planctomycetota bacterium]